MGRQLTVTSYRLEARHVSKTFGSTRVLDDVELLVAPGEIHALIGQNGSGKSTVVKILTGYHAPDAGMSLALDGQPIELPVQWEAISAAGVSVVHQDLGLLDHASVAENIGVGGFVRSRFLRKIDWKKQREIAQQVLDRLSVEVDPATPVGALNATQRAEVGIARALRDQRAGGGVIILDEATRALPREELVRFHGLLKRVVAEGTSVLIVTHNLEEVLALADRVTVLRDGRVVGGGLETSTLTEQDMAKLMLGKTVGTLSRRSTDLAGRAVVATVTGLRTGPGRVPLDLEVRGGEIVGITGLPGTGFETIPYLVSGARPADAGRLRTQAGEVDLADGDVAACLRAGVALVPERRDRDGLAFEMSIRDNIALPNIRKRGSSWFVGRSWQQDEADAAIEKLSIKTRSADTLIKELSGGNQQKVLFAKWLSVSPQVLVLHEPTQAVDVGARQDILTSIQAVADSGVGVVLASGEPSDLVEVCDRILVLARDGRVVELRTDSADEVLEAIYEQAVTAPTPGGPA
ncbi:MAG: sugar ABC transporter ATP-binding protein [Candidatus Nanopelagicales bacterium]